MQSTSINQIYVICYSAMRFYKAAKPANMHNRREGKLHNRETCNIAQSIINLNKPK